MRQELLETGVRIEGGVLKYADLEKLKLLDAIMTEGLRLNPAAPGSLPRVVPKGGARIAGIWVPEDVSDFNPFYARRLAKTPQTTVSMMNYSTHHNADIFPRPFKFDPTRWLDTEGGTAMMKEAYMPFSRGPRMCIGIHLAIMELKMILATIVHGFQLSVGERTTENTMSITDHFVLMPKGGFCELYLRKVD